MDINELQETDTWTLYQQGQSFARMIDLYNSTDLNFRMYNLYRFNSITSWNEQNKIYNHYYPKKLDKNNIRRR